MNRFGCRPAIWIAGLIFLFATSVARSQDLSTIELEATPETIPEILFETLAAPAGPPSAAEFNRMQQMLNRHDKEQEVQRPPADAPKQPEFPLPQATNVGTLVNNVSSTTEGRLRVTLNRPIGVNPIQLSTINEPSAAVTDGGFLFTTGNWYAAFAREPTSALVQKNPFNALPAVSGRPGIRFCCDQIVQYDSAHKALIWLLQYTTDTKGNVVRIAVESDGNGQEITGRFRTYYTFSPAALAGTETWPDLWFDYPAMTRSGEFLYLTLNAFNAGPDKVLGTKDDLFERSVMLRMPLSELAGLKKFKYRRFTTTDFSLKPTFDGEHTLMAACHLNLRKLRVFSWPEDRTTLTSEDLEVQQWTGSRGESAAPSPESEGGHDWLGRSDPRVVAGWSGKYGTNRVLGFAWNAAQDKIFGGQFDFPHVRVALLQRGDEGKLKVIAQPHIWNASHAYAYPAADGNARGLVGISVCFGGGDRAPAHAVGVLLPPEPQSSTPWRWKLVETDQGSNAPAENTWGDYLSCLATGSGWVATGLTMHGGSDKTNMVPRVLRFEFTPQELLVMEAPQAPLDGGGALRADIQDLRKRSEALEKKVQDLSKEVETLKGRIK
jgi:hypothetical protein